MNKGEVRRDVLRNRRSLTAEQVRLLSAQIQDALMALPEYLSARIIASYVAKSDEVQTSAVIQSALSAGKRVLVPRTDPVSARLHFCEIKSLDELQPGTFGVLEPPSTRRPIPLDESQLVIVPVVAWDGKGQRLGYGKGFFDRELRHRGRAVCVGLAFEFQRHDTLPVTSSDVPLDIIVTEKRVLRFGGALHN
jgi:5-formyltetrahydrofolate cyclo-ligase